MFTWHAHETAVTALAFGPEGRFLVSAGADECVRVWDPLTGAEQWRVELKRVITFRNPAPSLCGVIISKDGELAAVQREGSGLVFIDIAKRRRFAERSQNIIGLCPGPDGNSVFGLVNSDIFGLRHPSRYSLEEGQGAHVSLDVDDSARAIAFAPDGSLLGTGRQFWPWPLIEPRLGVRIDSKDYEPDALAFSADNRHLFALVGGKIVVYGLPEGLFKVKLKGHNGRITAMALTPDGTRLWTASRDATVKCWDTRSLTLDRTYTFQTGGLDCLAVSPCGNVAAVGSGQKGTITLWDLN